LRRRPAELLREIDEHFEYFPVPRSEAMKDGIAGLFRRLQTSFTLSGVASLLILACQKTTGQRTPRRNSES